MTGTQLPKDGRGLPLSTNSPAAADQYNAGVDRLLSLAPDADQAFAAALTADEGFALAYAALAAAQQARGDPVAAKDSVAHARTLVTGATRRERQHVESMAAIVNGDTGRALSLVDEHLAEFPRDAVLANQGGTIFQFAGLEHRQQRRFDFYARLEPAYGDDWFFLASFAFAHHELDLLDRSRQMSERSLELCPTNASAAHNMSHVFYETNDHEGGTAFLDGWIATYDRRAPLHCHLSWHLALFELSMGRYARAIAIYDRSISPVVSSARNTLSDAASFLWRCQIYGDAPPSSLPWNEVCEFAAKSAPQPGLGFADAHCGLAYAAACDEAALEKLADGLRALDAKGHPIAGKVVLPLVTGIAAFARGDYEEAIRWLESISDSLVRIGGSNAQREVFQDTFIEACLRAGQFDKAEQLLRRRLERRQSGRDHFWLGRAEAAQGQTDAVRSSVEAARRFWKDAESGSPEQVALDELERSTAATA